jgi:hypothetical protein
MSQPSQTAGERITARIKELGEGAVFTPKDFLDLATRGMVDMTLKSLVREGRILRLGRGLYHSPKVSKLLKTPLSPDLAAVASALARRFRWRIVPSGAHAANLLGLSTQVPARAVYFTDGPTKRVKVDNRELVFKASRPRDLGGHDDPLPALVIQALKHLGKDGVTDETIRALREKLPPETRVHLLRDARYASDWIYAAAQQIAGRDDDGGNDE